MTIYIILELLSFLKLSNSFFQFASFGLKGVFNKINSTPFLRNIFAFRHITPSWLYSIKRLDPSSSLLHLCYLVVLARLYTAFQTWIAIIPGKPMDCL